MRVATVFALTVGGAAAVAATTAGYVAAAGDESDNDSSAAAGGVLGLVREDGSLADTLDDAYGAYGGDGGGDACWLDGLDAASGSDDEGEKGGRAVVVSAASAASAYVWRYAGYLRCRAVQLVWDSGRGHHPLVATRTHPFEGAAPGTTRQRDTAKEERKRKAEEDVEEEEEVLEEAKRRGGVSPVETEGGQQQPSSQQQPTRRALLGLLDGTGANSRAFATRSTQPMHAYLRRVQVENYAKRGKTAPPVEQVNGRLPASGLRLRKGRADKVPGWGTHVAIAEPRTAEAPFMTGPEKLPSSRVHQVNGGSWPHTLPKCRDLEPHDTTPCVSLANGGGAAKYTWGGDG